MKTGTMRNLLILLMLAVLTSTLACGAGGRDVYEVSTLAVDSFSDLILPDKKPLLKKKILVAPVINKAGISDSQAEEIRQDFVNYLSKDDYLLISVLKKWGDKDSASILTKYGTVINPAYAKSAEEKGMNIFLALVIHPIEVKEKRVGIWPNRKDGYNVLISMSVSALDTMNNTLIVYEDRTDDINFKEVEAGKSDKWTPDYNMLKSKISSMTKKICSSVIEKLRKQPWQSKVIVDGNDLVINAGTAIGLNENTVFEIFKKGELLESHSGGEYYLFGEKIGESVTRSISEDRAVIAANFDKKDAFYVRVKRSDD